MYVSDETKLISLIRTFINEFDENCKISVTDQNFKEKSVIELQNCLKEEILHLKLNQNENFETFITKHCMLQAKSDAVFNDLRKICNKNVND
uniref:CSON008105 protein n=1 Tax=Culicoides sonorensis TaxID=179676 RepID=A0A336KDZ0_CULSO